MRLNTDNDDILVQTLPTNRLARWTKPKTVDGIQILDKNDINRIHTNALTSSVDGSGLNDVSYCPYITKWINTTHPPLSGHSYTDIFRLKHNLLYTRTRQVGVPNYCNQL